MLLDYQQQRLVHGMERNLQTGREQTARLAASLEALSPFRVLSRGYSIAQKEDGTVLSSIQQVSVGEDLSLRLAGWPGYPQPQRERRNTDGRKETDL